MFKEMLKMKTDALVIAYISDLDGKTDQRYAKCRERHTFNYGSHEGITCRTNSNRNVNPSHRGMLIYKSQTWIQCLAQWTTETTNNSLKMAHL